MNAYEAIIGKRDKRDYDTREIPEDVTHRILQAGRMAGSSSNNQPIRLVVLNDRAVLEKLASGGRGTAPMLRAPLAVAIVIKQGGSGFDIGRVAQNMMVEAWAEGVWSCPQGVQDQAIAKEALGLPDDFTLGMCLAFGYPEASTTTAESRQRLPFDEVVHWGSW